MRIVYYLIIMICFSSTVLEGQKSNSKNDLILISNIYELAEEGLSKKDHRPLLQAVRLLYKNPHLQPYKADKPSRQMNAYRFDAKYLLEKAYKFAPLDNQKVQQKIKRYRKRIAGLEFKSLKTSSDVIKVVTVILKSREVQDLDINLNGSQNIKIMALSGLYLRLQLMKEKMVLAEDQSAKLCKISFDIKTAGNYKVNLTNLSDEPQVCNLTFSIRKQ